MTINIPNILTLSRLLLIPVFVYALLAEGFEARWLAAIAFGLAALSDWFDGYFARRLNQETEFGKIADPTVDRIFIAVAIIVIYLKQRDVIPLWIVYAIIGRDLAIVAGWLAISRHGIKVPVSKLGKTATGFLMSAFFILFADVQLNIPFIQAIGLLVLYIGVALALISGFIYLKMGIAIFKSKQASAASIKD